MSTWIVILALAAAINVMCAWAFGRAESALRDWGASTARRRHPHLASSPSPSPGS